MSNVVPIRAPQREVQADTFADAWLLLTDTMRRRSEAKAKCEALWNREARRLDGHDDLLARLRTYLRDDKDVVRTGGPGFHILLKTGRLDHWAPMQPGGLATGFFPHVEARLAVLRAKGEGFCGSYLDPCLIDGTKLVVRTKFAAKKLVEVANILKSHGFTGMKIAKREGQTDVA
jgi:hypothetical protein